MDFNKQPEATASSTSSSTSSRRVEVASSPLPDDRTLFPPRTLTLIRLAGSKPAHKPFESRSASSLTSLGAQRTRSLWLLDSSCADNSIVKRHSKYFEVWSLVRAYWFPRLSVFPWSVAVASPCLGVRGANARTPTKVASASSAAIAR